ncbi:MAG: TusE/DsrC/DsvC family sulfur relay protein [Propionibacteriaceae bacterium]|jgi:hypothetical protein|nr:TusE/DsrC/DsvC family sulfur relay protein [Propionibacteriaceae bacterium]
MKPYIVRTKKESEKSKTITPQTQPTVGTTRVAIKDSTAVETSTIAEREVNVDAEGFLTDYDQWDEQVGLADCPST